MPRLRHYDNLGTVRFITFSSYRREKSLLMPGTPELLIRHVREAGAKFSIRFFGYVIIPEHVHLVLLPPDGVKLSLVDHPGEYTWSSYNWYQGGRDVPFAMDEHEL